MGASRPAEASWLRSRPKRRLLASCFEQKQDEEDSQIFMNQTGNRKEEMKVEQIERLAAPGEQVRWSIYLKREESCHKKKERSSNRWYSSFEKKLNYTQQQQRELISSMREGINRKQARSKLSSLVILIVIATIAICCLPPSAVGYQLTNNLIANNLPPKFITSGAGSNSEIVVRVKEGPNSIGKLIYTLRGEDPDEDSLTFGVLGSTASDLLRIENVPGNQANVYLRKELDRETTESHQVVITLTDGKLGRGNWVEDVNDNYPVFGPHRTAISLREDLKVPQVIETIEASDQDEGRFGQVIYKLDESLEVDTTTGSGGGGRAQSIGGIFAIETIDGKGVISLISPLDYEQRALYQLRILATDRAIENERLTTSTSILISVEDCEDQPPMFTFVPSITRIPENLPVGSPVVRVSAVDGDRGINNKISYKLLSVNGQTNGEERQLFQIDAESGLVTVNQKLDREADGAGWLASTDRKRSSNQDQQPGSYVLQVRASELNSAQRGPEAAETSVTTELTILLTDVNDELPVFNQAAYSGEILENSAPESLVSFVTGRSIEHNSMNELLARVVDRDQGTNGTFTLELEGEQSRLFEIWPREATNEANFLIKIAPNVPLAELDFERRKQFQFNLIAREKYPATSDELISNEKRLGNSAKMTVFLRDSNDNYPQFEQDLYKVEIPENAIKGMHVCQVRASDADSGSFGTEGIRYTEIRGEKATKFKLDPLTGVITLKTSEHGFDRETVGQHHLIVEARDSNGLGNRNTTQLLIQLTDVNDQAPKFLLDQYEAFIYENELDFQSPLQVQAIDNDLPNSPNSRLTYSIVAGDPQQNFTIEPTTGRIRIRNQLLKPLSNQVDATAAAERQVEVTGSGTGNELEQGLDFERIAQKRDDARQFNLTIRATDAGVPEPLSDTTNVLVLVYDKNDHAPVFTRPVYFKSIKEDAKEGSQVLQVLAQDGDHSPTNSKITYRISSGGSDKFVIDSETGLISVATGANLDIDRLVGGQKRSNYLLSVLAFDGSFGPNQKSSSALVNITILDVNNKAPEFVTLGATRSTATSFSYSPTTLAPNQQQQQQQQQQFMVVHVNEDAPYGLIVTRVLATDPDSSAELRYSINFARSEARNDDMQLVDPALIKDLFSIEPQEGTIKVARPLDRETFDQVKLRLQVEDIAAQTADQVAYAHLLIKITDVNDNKPTFKRPIYKAVVNENSISGTSVITLTADDRDLNKTLKYSLEGAPEVMRLIRINSRSGEVTVNDKIDRELYSLLNVTVRAEDFGHPHSLSGSCQLLITVRDENDNNPTFLTASQLQNRRQATSLPRTPPTSAKPLEGEPTNAQQQPSNHNMNLNDTTYRLRSLTSGLARSLAGGGELSGDNLPLDVERLDSIIAEEHLGPTGSGGLPLLSPGATALISENAPIGHQLAYVRAEDADLANNGRVSYLLDALSSDAKFRIDRESGIISVAGSLDRELVKQYSLIIEACDNYELGYATGESRRAFTQVNIQLTDVNDNAPVISTNLQSPSSNARASSPEVPGPSYDEVMSSPGPYEMPLAECLFISEFQQINEPILTISAKDADDPSTPNAQIELAIVNNLPQNELFGLVQINKLVQPTSTTNLPPIPSDYLGFSDLSLGESSLVGSVQNFKNSTSGRNRLKRAAAGSELATSATSLLETSTGNIYSQLNRAASRSRSVVQNKPRTTTTSPALTTTTTTTTTQPPNLPSGAGEPVGEQQVHLVVTQSLKERVGNYSILVRATDRGQPALSSVKLINICVQDVNNHAPIFTRPPLNHTIRIQENATLGTYVTQVEASDSDHGLNGELHYSLKQVSNNLDWQSFKIDRQSGVITSTKLFNRQVKKYYSLRVQAQDFGKPTSLSNDIDINIMIVNSGQYQPEFDQQTQQLQFTENIAPGVEWFTLLPTTNLDDDPALINAPPTPSTSGSKLDGPNKSNNNEQQASWLATPCYFIIDSDDYEQVFHLDRYTHHLTNQKVIDRERKANYTLIVQASNSCSQPPANHKAEAALSTPPTIDYRSSSVESSTESSKLELGEELKISLRTRRQALPAGNRTGQLEQVAKPEFDRFNPTAVEALLAADKSLLKVVIKVKDVNDNAPKFTQKVYTGGITTEADFGTVFMIVQALDADADQNSQVVYSLVKPVTRRNLVSSTISRRSKRATSGSAQTSSFGADLTSQNDIPEGEDLFVINKQTGEISLNFDPQKHMKGYFEFEVMANDTDGLFDSAKVYIYLLRQDQRVKFVLRLTPQELRQRLNKFRSVIGNITGAIVNIDSYKYFENHDGTVDKKKTSLFLHFVNLEDNTIIEVDKVLTLIDNNIEYLDELYKEFHVLSSEAAQLPLGSSALIDPVGDQVRTGLMGVSSFLALILILLIALFLNQKNRYERQLKAATVSAFGSSPLHLSPDFQSQTNLPNTNLHSQDPNPIWVNGYSEDWLGAGGLEAKNKEQPNNRKSQRQTNEPDYLSSENSDSLSGVGGHYNAAATATPRDSLSSSQGRVSGSAGSNSTTNERQALCLPAGNGCQTPSSQQPIGVLKKANQFEVSRQKLSADGGHSTFGAFKEVTIYTEEQLDKQRPLYPNQQAAKPTNSNNLVRTILQTEQPTTSQVNKLASHFNSKQQFINNNQTANKTTSQVYIGQHQQHRILVHANGADPTQGIIKSNRLIQQQANNKAKQLPYHHQTNCSEEEQHQQTTTNNIDTNLSKLSILNLETTEL